MALLFSGFLAELIGGMTTDSLLRGTKRCYGAGGEEMAPSSLWLTDGVPRCPSRTT